MSYKQIRRGANIFAVYNIDGTLNRFIDASGRNVNIPHVPGDNGQPVPSAPTAVGPQTFVPTPVGEGTFWVGVTDSGLGDGSSYANAKALTQAVIDTNCVAGGVMFVRGGTYPLPGTSFKFQNNGDALNPIIFEAVAGETPVIDGVARANGNTARTQTYGDYIQIRQIEIKNCPWVGLRNTGSNNTFDSVYCHNNRFSGFHNIRDNGGLANNNRWVNCHAKDNSDAGDTIAHMNDGGNADGFGAFNGNGNIWEYCKSDSNSDDGFDLLNSTNGIIRYCISKNNIGEGTNGEGKGIKAGQDGQTNDNLVEFNLIYGNDTGMNSNGGSRITFRNNTCYNQVRVDRWFMPDTIVQNNISASPGNTGFFSSKGVDENNSWQRAGTVSFISVLEANAEFLVPVVGGGFDDIGALLYEASTP